MNAHEDHEVEWANASATVRRFGFSKSTLCRYINDGRITAKRHGNMTMIDLATVRQWFKDLPDARDVDHGKGGTITRPVKRIETEPV